MRLKKLGAALLVVVALGAVLASSALAAAVTEDVKWYIGASPGTELSGSETMSAEAVGTGTFKTHVSGVLYEASWSGVECIECKIENREGSASGSGKLKLTGVSMVEPAGCSVASTITTNALFERDDWGSGGTSYVKMTPTKGESTTFVTIEITGCPLATSIALKGNLFVQSVNGVGVQAVVQETLSSEAINEAAGGNLHVGTESASISQKMKFKMSGAKAGVAFGTH